MRRTTFWLTFGLLAAVLLAVPPSLHAQATIPVSGSKVVDNNRQLLTGQLVFTVTNTSDVPVTYTPQGGSPTTATFTIPVVKGAVQYIGGFPPTIANPATMSPANTRYRIQTQSTGGGTTYFTFPLTNITMASFSYDGYIVPAGITISGAGIPTLNCSPSAMYNNTLASDPYPWVCSKLQGDASVYWTQNPSLNPSCQRGNDQAIASSINGTTFCIDANQAYVTPGFVWAGPLPGQVPTQIGLVPLTTLCAGGACGAGVVFPTTPSIVFNTSTVNSRNATFADIFSLFTGSCTGTNVPQANGTCGPGGGTPNGAGVIQYGNSSGTAFFSGATINTDAYGTAAAAQAAGCGTACDLFTPATSTDGNAGWSLGTQPGKISNMWVDHRGNRDSKYFTNPQPAPSFPTFSQGQAAHPENLLYTEPNPSGIAGSEQSNRVQLSQYSAPGFSNGQGGCPLFCPPVGYTGLAAWTIMNEFEDTVTFNSAGISDYRATHCDFSGIGDHQCGLGGVFVQYAGGFVAPSDEGLYGIGSVHMATMGDWQGTLTAVVDANHIKASQFSNEQKQGQGRFILDFTTLPRDAGGVPLSTTVPVDLINEPVGATPGYITINSVTLPASTAVGTLTNNCTVPTQFGGVAIGQNSLVNGCAITVTSGTFVAGTAPVCMAYHAGNLFNIGMQMVSAPTNLSGGQQTIFATMHRSVPAGSIVFQGGACGWGINLNGDVKSFQSLNNSVIFASVFPIIGSDAHRMYYINYDSSQVWTTIPNAGSQWGSRDTGNHQSAKGFSFPTLTRVGGVVTGVTGSHGQQGHPGYQMLNQTQFIAVTGCTEPTMNSTGVGSFTGMPGPEPGRLVYGLPGPDNVCTNATISMANTTVGPVFLAEVYDVTNHGFGLAPFNVVDGTFAISYQPNFVVNDTLDSPTHYAAAAVGLRISDELAQPNQQNIGLWLNMQNVGSYTGQAININANAPSNEQWGSGGSGYPLEVLSIHGYVGNIIDSQYAPAPGSSVITMGFASPGLANSSVTNSTFRNYNIWQLNSTGGGVAQDTLNFDMDTQTYCWTFNFINNGTCHLRFSPSGSLQTLPAQFTQAQFDIFEFSNGGYVPITQITECSPIPTNGASPLCYNPIITNKAVITQGGAAGTTQYNYLLAVNDVAGLDFSPLISTFTGNATLSGTNFNNIPCSDLPVGKTGTIYLIVNPVMTPIGSCPSAATVVHDTGSHTGGSFGLTPMIDGGIFDSGGFRVQGATGFYSFSNPDVFNAPFAITASINQTAAGILSVNTTATGNTLGELDAAVLKQAGSVVCTAANGLCTGGAVGVSSINGTPGAFTFTGSGVSCTTTTCTFSGTGTGVTTFNTRSGPVTPASGDYSFSLLSGNLGNAQGPSSLTGILKDAAGALSVAVAADFPTLNQSTTGTAAFASALVSTPTLCSTGQAPTGILANGNATGCASIAGGGGSVGSVNQFQVAGSTAGSFAAPPGITYVFSGTAGTFANGIQLSANFSGIPPLSTFLANVVGSQTSLATNAFYNGTNWVTQTAGPSVNLRHPLSSSAIGTSTLSVCPTLAAGATITGMNTTCVAEWTEYNSSGPRTWFNSQLLSPTFPTNAALVLNPSANWFVDYSGNQTLNNLTVNGTCTGCGAGGGGITGQTAGYAIEAATATTATGPFPMDDAVTAAGFITFHKNVQIIGTGTANGWLIPEGTAITGVALSAALYPATSTHRWMQNPNNIGALMIPGIATAATAAHLAVFAANGIDLADGGAVPTSGFPFTLGSTSIAASSTTTAVTGLSVNGVTLNAAGSTSLFLNQAGGYTTPAGSGTITASPKFQLPFYSATGTANTLTGDSGITTDGAGNLTVASISTSVVAGIGGTLTLPEGTVPTAATSKDICYGDSTAHAILCSYNNGAFVPLVTTTATQTLTGKTLDGVTPATMAFVDFTSSGQTQLNGKAPIASPTFTGTVTIPSGAALGTPASEILTNATGLPTAGLVNNAVNSSKLAVVNTYQVCDIPIGDTSGAVITNAQLGPQSRACFIPAAATIVEMDVNADGGTPNIIIGRNHAGTIVNIVSAALATAASGGIACSKTTAVTGLNGATTCSATLQNTSLSAGDYLELVSGTAGGTAKFMVAHVIYTVN